MKNYFEKLQQRVDRYNDKYHKRSHRVALNLTWWNFKCIFKKHKQKQKKNNILLNVENQISFIEDQNSLKTLFYVNGGLGDELIVLNYLFNLKNKFGLKTHFDIAIPKLFNTNIKTILENNNLKIGALLR